MYQGTYNGAMSGILFPLITASGTYAKNFNTTSISAIFIGYPGNGGYTSLSGRMSGIPGDGVYTITNLTAIEMQCYTWAIKITANSGCLDQTILGQNLGYSATHIITAVSGLKNDVSGLPGILAASSGPVVLRPGTHTNALVGLWGSTHTSSQIARVTDLTNAGEATVDVSTIAAQVWNSLTATYTSSATLAGNIANVLAATSAVTNNVASGFAPVIGAISGLKNDVSGLPGILTATSGTTTAVASGFAPIIASVSSIPSNISSTAKQVWETVRDSFTSSTTFGATINVSGLDDVLPAVSGLSLSLAQVSGLTNLMTQLSSLSEGVVVSGMDNLLAAVSGLAVDVSGISAIMDAVSGVPSGIANFNIADSESLTSGTMAHTMRLVRWFAWEDLFIDKTYLPNRLYMRTDATNYSSWFSLIDNVNYTERIRGG